MSTQMSEARTAGQALSRAKSELEAAKRAPHTGSATANRLKAAEGALTQAQNVFRGKYGAYVASERKDDPTRRVESESYFM